MRLQDVVLRDTRANQPSFADVPPGTLFYVTDEQVTERCADDGLSWEDYSDAGSGVGAITSLTGDVTATGPGAAAATIANDAVTLAKIANAAANSVVIGAGSAGIGINYTEITLGAGLSMTGTVLDAIAGSGGITELTGDVTAGPGSGSQAATIPADTVTFAKMQNIATGKVLGRGTAASGDIEELTPVNGIETTSTPGLRLTTAARTHQRGVAVDGGGAVVTTGVKGYRSFPVAGTLTGWRLLANGAGNVNFTVYLDPYASFPPTTSILTPSLSGVDQNEATGLSQAVAAGDIFGFEITGTPTVMTWVVLELTIVVTG